ncbi:hypothetical protein PHMEG_0006893 [Phytophthora megakarya]|uniref:Uncharacterized protein n=1 Tax=Phytophthora megakarya TaxID=4795 RepID=A0A225WMP3_9STRA|nr:hypothetical protein PHMEG_0006893 [Phytophthora megakarya]
MVSSSSSSSSQSLVVEEVVPVEVGDSSLDSSSSSNATGSTTHQPLAGSNPTATVSNGNSESSIVSTPVLLGIIAASVFVFVAIMFVIRSRRRRCEPKFLSVFRTSRSNRENELPSVDSRGSFASTVPYSTNASTPALPIEQRSIEGDAWRDLSDTCWSIGPDSDSEAETERYTMSSPKTQGGPLVLKRNRLSTLSDNIADVEEEDTDIYSIDESSRRKRGLTLDELSPRRERGISQFDDSSPRRVRGLSALASRQKASSVDVDTNDSAGSYFSVDSGYYDETIKDCNSVFFDSDSESDSDESLREEEF